MNLSKAGPPPLLLLPGLICDDTVWRASATAIEGRKIMPISGYGGVRSLEAMASAVLAKAPPAFALAGHSMGARVALEVLRLAPRRVERLALLDTAVHPRQPGEFERRMALLRIGREQGMEALVDAWLPPMVHPARRRDDALMGPLRRMCIAAGIRQFENQVTALLNRPDARPLLKTISCPTLVAAGRQDEWSPVGNHEEIAAAISTAELVVFEDTGHMAPAESPQQVARAMSAWLARPAI